MANTYRLGTRIFCVTRAKCGYVCRPVMVGVGGVEAAATEADKLADQIDFDVENGALIKEIRVLLDVTDYATVPETYRVLEILFDDADTAFLIEKDEMLVEEQTFADDVEAYAVITQSMSIRQGRS